MLFPFFLELFFIQFYWIPLKFLYTFKNKSCSSLSVASFIIIALFELNASMFKLESNVTTLLYVTLILVFSSAVDEEVDEESE